MQSEEAKVHQTTRNEHHRQMRTKQCFRVSSNFTTHRQHRSASRGWPKKNGTGIGTCSADGIRIHAVAGAPKRGREPRRTRQGERDQRGVRRQRPRQGPSAFVADVVRCGAETRTKRIGPGSGAIRRGGCFASRCKGIAWETLRHHHRKEHSFVEKIDRPRAT